MFGYKTKSPYLCTRFAPVAELVDALVSNTNIARCAGSSPARGTQKEDESQRPILFSFHVVILNLSYEHFPISYDIESGSESFCCLIDVNCLADGLSGHCPYVNHLWGFVVDNYDVGGLFA